MKKKNGPLLAALLGALLCSAPLTCPAMAAVATTAEAAGGPDAVYVAGAPDWYPVEYYDAETDSFQGILPELLGQVSEKTGLSFVYLRGGEGDQRLRMAENNQVEIVSACTAGDGISSLPGVTPGGVVLAVPRDGETVEVRFAYTGIAGASLMGTVEDALGEISQQEITALALGFMTDHPPRSYPAWLLPAALGLSAVLLLALVLLLWRTRRKRRNPLDEWLDPATGIGNKAYFLRCLEEDIPEQYRGLYCVVYISFDIARVNQYYGEEDAEEQLRFAAGELNLSTVDNEVFARVSGGGFAVARPTSGENEAAGWTERLLERLNRYTEKYGKDFHPVFSAGIYMVRPEDRDGGALLRGAQQGCREAVSRGASYAFSRAEQISLEGEQLQLKKQTLAAIQNRQFKMFLQFVVRADGGIYGAEALSRWDHPQRGLLYPSSYIDLMALEKTLSELDFYIFDEACRQLESWGKQGRNLSLSCNFARITIDQENFVSRLEKIARSYRFDHARLVMEITEDTLESHKQTAFENISKCKAMGFRIALDDMGSGFTSFSDLRDYPIDVAKIDRSILTSAVNRQGVALLRGMIALSHSLGIEVLCEGVETSAQAELLRQLGCDYMQGYYFYRALPAREANRFLDGGAQGAPKAAARRE